MLAAMRSGSGGDALTTKHRKFVTSAAGHTRANACDERVPHVVSFDSGRLAIHRLPPPIVDGSELEGTLLSPRATIQEGSVVVK